MVIRVRRDWNFLLLCGLHISAENLSIQLDSLAGVEGDVSIVNFVDL